MRGERNELCQGIAISSWLQTSCGVRIRNKRPSSTTFSACAKIIRGQAPLCLHGVKIRWDHAGKWSRCCWGLWDQQLLVGSSWAVSISPPGNASWLSSLLPLFFSSTIFIFSVPSYPARLFPPYSFSGGQGRSFLCQEQSEATRGKRCQLCWWGWMAPSPLQMPGVFHLAENVSQACSLLKAPSLRSQTQGTRTGAVSPALELKFPNLWSSWG